MRSILRQLYVAAIVVLVAGCSGGGCSSCAGGAIQPIRGGFPLTPERRIPHAMQIRLTDQGLRSVSALAPDLLAGFIGTGVAVPSGAQDLGVGIVRYCPSGMCRLTISLPMTPPGLELGFVGPDQISVRIRFVARGDIPLQACIGSCSMTCGGLLCGTIASPTIRVDTAGGSYGFIGMSTRVAIRRDTHVERRSYFRADLISPTGTGDVIQETPGEGIEPADMNCTGSWICGIINLLRSTLVDQFRGQISGALGPVQDALAASAMPDPPGCPTGTTVNGTRCRYADGSQVPMLLGTDGQGNLGALMATMSPGLRANNSFVIAAGDHDHNSEVTTTGAVGMTLNTFGTFVSTTHNRCVPMTTAPPLPMIPEWMALRRNVVPGTTTTIDLGIGVAEEFLNNTMWNLWDSGMFCLGVNTRLSQQLSSGLFAALPPLGSLRNVIFPAMSSAMAMALRPQRAPTIQIGSGANLTTNPLLLISFQQLAIDFYAWSEERYVRFMTVNTDMTIPMNLVTDTTGLRPTLGMVRTANTTVSNSQLIREMPANISTAIEALLGSAIGMFAGNLPSVALPSIPVPGPGGMPVGSIAINVPAMGVQGTTEGASRFLGIFANLRYRRTGMMQTIEMDTRAELERLPFDASVYEFRDGWTVDQLPRFRLRMSVPETFGRDVEYAYRVDDLAWSAWSREAVAEVSSTSFMSQGQHHVDVRARVIDEPETSDREPVRVTFDIDTRAPTVEVARRGRELVVEATDEVVSREHIEYNVSFDHASSEQWTHQSVIDIPNDAHNYVVRVRDDSGNERRLEGRIDALLIRGGPSTDASAGCGCSAPGAPRNDNRGLLATVGMLGIAAMFARRVTRRRGAPSGGRRIDRDRARRRGQLATPWLLGMLPLALGIAGCSCGTPTMMTDGGMTGTCDGGARLCRTMNNRCIAPPACECPAGQEAMGNPTFNDMTCAWSTDPGPTVCNCTPLPPLTQGLVGSHLDMAVHTDNTIWLSAYSPGDPGQNRRYGDLVAGRYDMAASRVTWTHVDGVPTGVAPMGDPTGWRGGITDPGDDVGRWNSMRLNAMGQPRIAYWDTTNDDLKFASFDGSAWRVHVVDHNNNAGRYASLVMLAGDIPAIAYRATLPDPMMAGRVITRIRYARANSPNPQSMGDWMISDVASGPTQCRASDCAAGQACVRASGRCEAVATGCAMCTSAQACIGMACADVYTPGWIEDYPPGFLFPSLAIDNMQRPALVYYDRDRGNLMGVRSTSATAWSAPFIVDGEVGPRDGGDRGIWSTMTVDSAGLWHVAYVDAYEERVLYVRVNNGMVMGMPEVVDDGDGLAGTAFTDGHHIIGDSLSIALDGMGVARVAYQDSTAGTLRLAVRGAMAWTPSVLDMMASTGYWARLRGTRVATYFRDMQMRRYGVRVQTVP